MNNLIVRRTADQQNIFYLGNAVEFEKRIHEYWATTTDKFELLDGQQQDNIIREMNATLKTMHHDKHINDEQFKQLTSPRSKQTFPIICFLPQLLGVILSKKK